MHSAQRLLLLQIAAAIGLAGCGSSNQLDQAARQQIETQIYTELAGPYCSSTGDILYPNTLPMPPAQEIDWQKMQAWLPALELATWESYLTNNAEVAPGHSLQGMLPDCEGRFLACDLRFCDTPDSGGQSVPSIIGFSRLGLNSGGTQALIYVVNDCQECGWGGFLLLERANGIWQIVDEYRDWVS